MGGWYRDLFGASKSVEHECGNSDKLISLETRAFDQEANTGTLYISPISSLCSLPLRNENVV